MTGTEILLVMGGIITACYSLVDCCNNKNDQKIVSFRTF